VETMRKSVNETAVRPKKRSRLRIFFGTLYYRYRRYLWWYFGGVAFCKKRSDEKLPFVCFTHHTPLFRQLKNVDIFLQYNKITNLKLAVKRLDGLILYPGETFSYWKAIGRPTRRKGYAAGMVLFCGTYRQGIGGGLCQLSNLIYWMTLHTDLTVTERYRHSYDVFPDTDRTQPFGSGATCVYNYRDLMVKNETTHPFQLCLKVTETNLEGEWRSSTEPLYTYQVYEKQHSLNLEYWGGYSRNNILYRKKFNSDGVVVQDEYLTENHALMMYAPFLEAEKQKKAAADE